MDATEADLLALAAAAARAGGEELLARFGEKAEGLRTKSTATDPVSEADEAAERAIRSVLARARPEDAVLGEEGGAAGARDAALRWVVDPLDGTVNFLFGLPSWAVSVAVEDDAGAVAGVVLDPLRGEEFAATRSGPALRDGEPITGSAKTDLGFALVATGFSYDPGVRAAQAEVLVRVLPAVRDIRRYGAAALDLCWCACGRFDAYWERGLRPWDWAAGLLVCERAGLATCPLPALGPQAPEGWAAGAPALVDPLVALVEGSGAHGSG